MQSIKGFDGILFSSIFGEEDESTFHNTKKEKEIPFEYHYE
jgi:hypothetical protein